MEEASHKEGIRHDQVQRSLAFGGKGCLGKGTLRHRDLNRETGQLICLPHV